MIANLRSICITQSFNISSSLNVTSFPLSSLFALTSTTMGSICVIPVMVLEITDQSLSKVFLNSRCSCNSGPSRGIFSCKQEIEFNSPLFLSKKTQRFIFFRSRGFTIHLMLSGKWHWPHLVLFWPDFPPLFLHRQLHLESYTCCNGNKTMAFRPCLHVMFLARFCRWHLSSFWHILTSCVNSTIGMQSTHFKTERKLVQKTLRVNQA